MQGPLPFENNQDLRFKNDTPLTLDSGLLSNVEHQKSILKMATGGDDQNHVSLPQIKEQIRNSTAARTGRKDMRHLFTKNISR